MQTQNKIWVIGIGPEGLSERAKEIIASSDAVVASPRLSPLLTQGLPLYLFSHLQFIPISPLDGALNFIKANRDRIKITVLASGDPLFFGIGRRLIEEFGKDSLEFIPAPSCIQLAFSRIKESWDDASFLSLHGRGMEYLFNWINRNEKIAILTDSRNAPSMVATILHDSEVDCIIYVFEKLGFSEERIVRGSPDEIRNMQFSEPNLMVVIKAKRETGPVFGLKEDEFAHTKGLITKDELRAVTIAKLRLPEEGVFWDIGAGSGSVSIEASRICQKLRVFAIEKDALQIKNIRENIRRFSAHGVVVIEGPAPESLFNLPGPDRVFIGGSGGRLKEILEVIDKKMEKGVIVINATTIETLKEAVTGLETVQFSLDITEISVSRTKRIGGKRHLSALNPVFIIVGER